MEQQQKDYTAVPPPSNLTGSSAPVDFNDALSKARAIAEKLKQQQAGNGGPSATAGSKRGYQEESYHDDSRDYSSRSYESRDHYGDRETKRGMYESNYGESRRYGLGTDERRNTYGAVNAEPIIKKEMSVPSSMVGMIIGKGGENLRKTERMSGAKVQFTEDTGAPERIVEITGEADQVKIAGDMIQQVIDDGRANESVRYGGRSSGNDAYAAYGGSSRTSSSLTVPSFRVGLIIGRGGETIRDLEERSGAKININPEPPGSRSEERIITLSGDDAAVRRAKDMINDLLDGAANGPGRDYRQQQHGRDDHRGYGGYGGGRSHDNYGSYGQHGGGGGYRGRPGEERDSVTVPRSSVGFIIGKGGETVRMLQDQSGARIKVDQNVPPDAPDRVINIFGNPDAVAYAKQLIMDKVEEGNANYGGHGGGGRYRNDNHRRGYGSGGYKDNYGSGSGSGYDQQYSGQYQSGTDASGYDYSQYQQYYAQYYGNQEGEAANQGYQYGGYPYDYGQYGASGAAIADEKKESSSAETENASEKEGAKPADESTAETAASQSKSTTTAEGGADKDDNNNQDAAYYAQYYGGTGDQAQQQQWTQEAYYRWYQQYYGNQYAGTENQQLSSSAANNEQQQQQPSAQIATSDDSNKEAPEQ